MPRIVKWQEKVQLIKVEPVSWEMDLERKYKSPPAISSDKYLFNGRGALFDIIENLIEETLPHVQDKFFDQFVDIKEVPYGRHNSDTDHQGS